MRVLVCDPIEQEGLEALYEDPTMEIVHKYKSTEEEIIAIAPEYDAILVRSATKITKAIIDSATNLKVIGRAGVGVDNIDLDAATLKGIVVVNAPDGNTIAATEHTIGMMLALARNIPQAYFKLQEKVWDRKAFTGVELRNKTLGVVGLGKIGRQVAQRAKAFQMNVVGYDPYVNKERSVELDIEVMDLKELFAASDFITVHLPKTEETMGMINAETIAMMKDGVRILNCARGGIIDEPALYDAIKAGKVKGAAIDVFLKEPAIDNPLLELPEVIATPHLGASTEEAQFSVAKDVAEEVLKVLKGEPVKNAVNIPSISQELINELGPYIGLSETLGKFIAQIMDKPIEKIKINYNGNLAKYDLTTLTNTILKGLLRPVLADSVNYVNAPIVAKNRGIKVEEIKTESLKNYANLITLEVEGSGVVHNLAGTIFSNGEAKLVQLDNYSMDTTPTKHMLIVPHNDKPGMIGHIGNILGKYDVNVAGMQVGRKEIGGVAIMIISIDHSVPTEALEAMCTAEGIFDVRYVCL
ncbi:D-3-phosphoglycerate dehydrogenase [Desulfonispora thiosulfatigenes DSM 11270]|uniref:D-3-phosphoglycerate dehydrogenase n=1 Tax=Desulfonispora thiosulfatigenes DSM 11270 TaxID=656914 RepID=A0A1W1V2C7_DESTI|nr:phosphoglycerate dehydrogenase [Desulfonispora thiosulfatigenes]SMB87450.1 D-3-phosphoglycerate dehydrogenase [Desulfonispora thiosulfatigenes DSM 11270]